ncbi:hypothetical protein BTO32_02175 [Marinobacter lutaoensis]|uniref:DUF1585 domain-containing protein n=1 Tax=Marinobacter lutaoensis TaxID=135739 RepID=A0A1V2DX83_9GAMM|nr:hypothetical protein [Marinobacter lutaoensis]ONF45293.1 hypothetical protein BTO32_02175 [Marinobacter lutaoensis]
MNARQGLQTLIQTALGASLALTLAHAGPREQAKVIHDRIAGVPPSAEVLDTMAAQIENNDALGAAFTAMEDPAFYDVTLKNLAAPWTNEAMSVFVPLNDYIATVIGLVRDGEDFRKVLYDDVLYVGDPSLGLPPYANDSNAHYEALEDGGYSLKDALVRRSQSAVTGLPYDATAGVITSRASARAFFSAGTNRAMFRFTLLNHLCKDLEQVADVTLPTDRIRQDVSRSPGGDSRVFLNNCVGCHSGMDPMAQAFAYYDYAYDADADPDGALGRLVYHTVNDIDPATGSRVQAKYHINAGTFEQGFITPDDRWDNYWRQGANRRLGWDPGLPGGGQGAKSLGQELAHSDAFAECQVTKVFQAVCLRPPSDSTDRARVASMVTHFRNAGFDLKQVFAESAVYCMGE